MEITIEQVKEFAWQQLDAIRTIQHNREIAKQHRR